MSAQHTPGPWAYSKGGRIKVDNGATLLASAWHTKKMPDALEERISGESWLDASQRLAPQRDLIESEMEANARLIAAAPELLSALKDFKEASDKEDSGFDAVGWLDRVDALIAKAEGT